jgi:hypothetical protein
MDRRLNLETGCHEDPQIGHLSSTALPLFFVKHPLAVAEGATDDTA